jgi:hypothetical protein
MKTTQQTAGLAATILIGVPMALLVLASPVQAATIVSNGDIAYSYIDGAGTRSDVFTVHADGTGVTNITQANGGSSANPSYSPDGTKIIDTAYAPDASPFAGQYKLNLMNPDGTGSQSYSNGTDDSNPAWGPTQIAFTRGTDIYTINPDGTNETNLTQGSFTAAGSPVWSTDGSKLYFAENNPFLSSDILLMNSNGASAVATGMFGRPQALSPDGTTFLFLGDFTQNIGDRTLYSASVNVNGGLSNVIALASCDFANIVTGDLCVYNATISPDGAKIASLAFYVNDPFDQGTWQYGLFTMNLDGTNLVNLVDDSDNMQGLLSRLGISWQSIITVTPTPPTPDPSSPTAGAVGSVQADAATLAESAEELPAAGVGGAAGYAGAMAAYGAYRMTRKRWDIHRKRRA